MGTIILFLFHHLIFKTSSPSYTPANQSRKNIEIRKSPHNRWSPPPSPLPLPPKKEKEINENYNETL